MIAVENLRKEFNVRVKQKSFLGAIGGSFQKKKTIEAVRGISFNIEQGEFLGFLGPNGAGKSTTIKILSGILVPSGGTVLANGLVPSKDRIQHAKNIGVVFGQRTQLWWDLPLIESLKILRHIYDMKKDDFNESLRSLVKSLEVEDFLHMPVRNLSLGQRMRGDLLASLVHRPKTIFLDEPTIGLDVVGKAAIRELLSNVNKQSGTTVLLTTHDMVDVEQTCERLLVIDKGSLIFNGTLKEIKKKFGKMRRLIADFFQAPSLNLEHNIKITKLEDGIFRYAFEFNSDHYAASELISLLANSNNIKDVSIEETSIEEIIAEIYKGKVA